MWNELFDIGDSLAAENMDGSHETNNELENQLDSIEQGYTDIINFEFYEEALRFIFAGNESNFSKFVEMLEHYKERISDPLVQCILMADNSSPDVSLDDRDKSDRIQWLILFYDLMEDWNSADAEKEYTENVFAEHLVNILGDDISEFASIIKDVKSEIAENDGMGALDIKELSFVWDLSIDSILNWIFGVGASLTPRESTESYTTWEISTLLEDKLLELTSLGSLNLSDSVTNEILSWSLLYMINEGWGSLMFSILWFWGDLANIDNAPIERISEFVDQLSQHSSDTSVDYDLWSMSYREVLEVLSSEDPIDNSLIEKIKTIDDSEAYSFNSWLDALDKSSGDDLLSTVKNIFNIWTELWVKSVTDLLSQTEGEWWNLILSMMEFLWNNAELKNFFDKVLNVLWFGDYDTFLKDWYEKQAKFFTESIVTLDSSQQALLNINEDVKTEWVCSWESLKALYGLYWRKLEPFNESEEWTLEDSLLLRLTLGANNSETKDIVWYDEYEDLNLFLQTVKEKFGDLVGDEFNFIEKNDDSEIVLLDFTKLTKLLNLKTALDSENNRLKDLSDENLSRISAEDLVIIASTGKIPEKYIDVNWEEATTTETEEQ